MFYSNNPIRVLFFISKKRRMVKRGNIRFVRCEKVKAKEVLSIKTVIIQKFALRNCDGLARDEIQDGGLILIAGRPL